MAIQDAFVWGAGGTKKTPEQVAREREIAEAILMKAGNTSPVGHWTQGAARVVDALGGVIKERRAAAGEREIADVNKGLISSLLSGSGSAPASSSDIPMTGAAGEVSATSPAAGGPEAYRNAIASIESAGSGDYAAVGPANETLGRPLGRYQIMEANIGPWSREVLGREVTPDEFLANPQLQDAIFDKKFGSYVQQYGPEGAAQAWFAGPGGVGKVDRSDVLGTSVGEYGQRFTSALGQTEVASATPQAAIEAISPTQGGSLTDEVAAFEQTPAYSAQFPGQTVGAQGGVPPLSAPVEVPTLPVAGPQDAVTQAITQQPVEVAGGGDRQGVNPAIIEALTNPQASPQTQRVAAILLEQEQRRMQAAEEQRLQAADPMRRLQLEKAQIEVERLRNPQADIPDSVRALNIRAQQAGLQPGTPEYNQFMISGGSKGITVDARQMGNIPPGYKVDYDDQGRPVSMSPIEGSPAALEAAQAQRSIETQGGRKETATDVITGAATNARNILKDSWFTTGTPGRIAANLSESPAAELRRQVDVLKSNATIENLTAMRQASPTGGALGSVTEKEGAMLAAAAGAIDPNASKPDVEKALDTYERTLLRVIHGPKVGDAIFEQTRVDKPISEMTDEELEALANGD